MLLVACYLLPGRAYGQGNRIEYRVKAAFLLNFTKFISWPEEQVTGQNDSFTICIIGDNPFGDSLSALEQKRVRGKRIEVTNVSAAEAAGTCKLIFVSSSERDRVDEVIGTLAGYPAVTVSDIQGFTRKGGVIEFVEDLGRLAFKINLRPVSHKGISFDASLLSLARDVIH